MVLFNLKKFRSFLPLLFVIFTNPIIAQQLLSKPEILRKSNECFKEAKYKSCSNLILEMEKNQLFESDQNNYKCQASILGLQTELIESHYFKKVNKGFMIPYVIKNC